MTNAQAFDNKDTIAKLTDDLGALRAREIAHTREHNEAIDALKERMRLNEMITDNNYMSINEQIAELQKENELLWEEIDNNIPATNHSHRKLFSWLWNKK